MCFVMDFVLTFTRGRGGGEDRNGGGWGRRGVKVTEKPYPRVLFSLSTTHLILAGCSLPRLRGRLGRLWMGKSVL